MAEVSRGLMLFLLPNHVKALKDQVLKIFPAKNFGTAELQARCILWCS